MNWDDIPSVDGLSVDWEYVPVNPLGKRVWPRIPKASLCNLLSVRSLPVNLVSVKHEKFGELIDVSPKGIAVELTAQLTVGERMKISFFLGRKKVVAHTLVRNVQGLNKKIRVGLEFMDLKKETGRFIAGLGAARYYR